MNIDKELFWLVLTIMMTALFWVPYIVNRMKEMGVLTAIWHPFPDPGPKAAWAERMMRAHENAVENLVIFAPLVVILHVSGMSTDSTVMACMIYFYARLAHFIVFTFAIPVLRVVSFLIGFYAQMVIGLTLLGIM